MEENALHFPLAWDLKKVLQSIPIDFENVVFGRVFEFNRPIREHFNHNIRVGPPRPKIRFKFGHEACIF